MQTLDKLQWHVLDAMADDWESIVQIRPHVAEFCGTTPDQRIFDILRTLHRLSFVRLMDSEGYGADAFPDDPRDYWFSMTESGRTLWDSDGNNYCGES
jgi:hypothetical protein